MQPIASTLLVLSADPVLSRHLLSVSAAVGLPADLQASTDDVRTRWRQASAVLVGVDLAPPVAELELARRPEVYVVARDTDSREARLWATRLGAAVVTLPDGTGDLASALATLRLDRGPGRVVAVVGGSGGVGASTLAAALAVTGARTGQRVLLVDADPGGGGIDIVLGGEHLAGWRWSRLAAARGHLGDLGGQLPHTDGVDVLAVDREPSVAGILRPEQLAVVLDSAGRSHDLTVVDLAARCESLHDAVLHRATAAVLVVRGDVRGVAAARLPVMHLEPICTDLGVVVRTGPGHGLDADLVADALALPLLGVLEDDPSVPLAAERGDPPGRSPRTSLGRLCHDLLHAHAEVAA